jgi:hypothetical protein
MPFSIVNGAPPNQTEALDSRGRFTAPWYAYLVSLQKANSGVTVGIGGINLNGQNLTGSATFTGAVVFGVAPSFTNAAGTRTNLGLGSAALAAASAFDAAGAATAAQTAAIAASLQRASNLSDLANAATARTNLGLGTAATQPSTAFDAAGAATAAQTAAIAASLQRASNLSDLANAATARTNLGLGTAATQPSTAFDAAGAATALLSSANTWAAAAVFSGAVTFSTPASLVFGSGWLSWTPTVTASGSMTITGLTITDAQYLRIGPLVFVKVFLAFTLGGTASNQIFISPPVTPLAGSQNSLMPSSVNLGGGTNWFAAWGFTDVAGGRFQVWLTGGGNYTLGSANVLFEGFYRCA